MTGAIAVGEAVGCAVADAVTVDDGCETTGPALGVHPATPMTIAVSASKARPARRTVPTSVDGTRGPYPASTISARTGTR